MLRRYLGTYVLRWTVVATVVGLALTPSTGFAFDDSKSAGAANGDVRAIFKFGFWADRNGKKEQAVKAYRDAAGLGHKGARWKLANMYAAGDGVTENDLEAFRMFEGIVREGAEPGTQNATFVAHALVSLADYIKSGIPESPVTANPRRARELLWQAAAHFGEANAQFKLGKMFLNGEGGSVDERQAARWFNLAAAKHHSGAKAMLGHMLFERGKTVRGLAMMTQALGTAAPEDHRWIREMQEEAFAVTTENERRTAIALAQSGN
ncbi:MAG: tetratricopeptide repeat protein [Pseudomonadota bacterium]